jgi:hypothetical protein
LRPTLIHQIDPKVSPVREAFQAVLGKATVYGLASQSASVAAQPVGFAAGRQAANERIQNLKNQVRPVLYEQQKWIRVFLLPAKIDRNIPNCRPFSVFYISDKIIH